jgi:3-hydroxyacyl-[acyl-carrier-protein] dehydratase
MRWIWIDRFVEFHSKQSARAVKNVSLAEDVLVQHFPGWPIMPASLMLEGLAQTGGILVGEANDFREKVVLAKIPRAQFYTEVLAGHTLTYSVQLQYLRPEGALVQGQVESEGVRVAEAEIFFAHLDQSRSQQLFGERNFVFSGELKHLLGLAKLVAAANNADAAPVSSPPPPPPPPAS